MLKERQFDNLIDAVREISRREILSGVCGRSGLWMATARPLPVEISRWSGAGPAASARRYLASVRVGRDRAAGGPNGPSGSALDDRVALAHVWPTVIRDIARKCSPAAKDS